MKKTIVAAGILAAAGFAGIQQMETYAAEVQEVNLDQGLDTGTETELTDPGTDLDTTEKTDVTGTVEEPKTDSPTVNTGGESDAEIVELEPVVELGATGDPQSAAPQMQAPAITNGWNANKTQYFEKGEAVKGQKQIDGGWYLFDDNGKKLTNFQNLRADQNHGEAKTCYYNANGQMLYGQQNINGYWYCFDLFTGAMFRGETTLSQAYEKSGAKTVFYNNNGQMQYGAVNGKFYDGVTGALQHNKLCTYKGKTYYAKSNGTIHKGELNLNGKWKYFDENGVMKTSFVTLEQGKNGFKDKTKTVYYNGNGDMLYGQQNINGKWYCFHNMTGEMFRNLTTLSTAYERSGAKTVLYDTDGHMLYGPRIVDGKDAYFDEVTGAMLKNTQKGQKYYGSDGFAVKGEVNIGGKWKCFNKDGNMVIGWFDLKNGELNYKGPDKRVYYNNKGEMVYKQQNIGGSWYCFEKNTGAMFRGEHYLDKSYEPSGAKTVRYYNGGANDGKMVYGPYSENGKDYYYNRTTGAKEALGIKEETINGQKGKVYIGVSGTKEYGQKCINGKWYYFDPKNNGFAATKLTYIPKEYEKAGAKTVYYNDDGTMCYGQKEVIGNWKYFKPGTGAMTTDEIVFLNDQNKVVYYDKSGNMAHSSFKIGNTTFYPNQYTGQIEKASFGNIPYYMQIDSRWAKTKVGGYPIENSGCNITVMTMIIDYLTGANYTPYDIGTVANKAGYYNNGAPGTTGKTVPWLANKYGLHCVSITSAEMLKTALMGGALVAGAMNPGIFCEAPNGTHEILVWGYDNGKTIARDPHFTKHNGTYDVNTIWNQRSTWKGDCESGGPIFALWAK